MSKFKGLRANVDGHGLKWIRLEGPFTLTNDSPLWPTKRDHNIETDLGFVQLRRYGVHFLYIRSKRIFLNTVPYELGHVLGHVFG